MIRISESDNFIVDYDEAKKKYRVSVFEDNHFQDEHWFDAFGEKEKDSRNIAYPVKRFEKPMAIREDAWWCGYCPNCGIMINYNYADEDRDNRKQYCWKCGQLCDFEDV